MSVNKSSEGLGMRRVVVWERDRRGSGNETGGGLGMRRERTLGKASGNEIGD